MKYAKIRQAFIEFFESKKHQHIASSSLIPHNDPTLMFTNAGMNQFKDVFLGTDKRDYKRAVTIQKCLRAGGKHNDLENVGFTARHHTFFEMLGNFSFGDYFKKEAIAFAWEFLTQNLGIPEERLYVTVFTTDDEAAEIWEKDIGVPKEKIFRYGEKDNFWRMGQTGPCGPCSEIFYDHNPDGPKIPLHEDEDRFVEVWNLVFMQFFEDEDGKQTPLPKPSVDTGAGIERLAAALQGFQDNYQCDVFEPMIKKTCQLAGLSDQWNQLSRDPQVLGAVKVVSDHARTAAFLIGEGVLPSNEGKGYVLRRIMRRAIRYGRKLNEKTSLYPAICKEVIQTMSPFYPELKEKKDFILSAVQDEEKRFLQTLDTGSEILQQEISKYRKQGLKELPGKAAVLLYDTYGFPFDLTEVIAKENGMSVNEEEFLREMETLKELARSARKTHNMTSNEKHLGEWTQTLHKTEFLGYETLIASSPVLAISDGSKSTNSLAGEGCLVFTQTPFYAEGGGQVADFGRLYKNDKLVGEVRDVKKMNDVFIHFVSLTEKVQLGDQLELRVHNQERQDTASNHSATHLMNSALKQIFGDHVNQAGSLVNAKKLRFDFNHRQPVTAEEIIQIENLVNAEIAGGHPVQAEVMGQKEAITRGATAMFGEKYGDEVRVLTMGSYKNNKAFSMELCGGTHVANTSEIRLFKIVSESGVAAGVRRIEALTGTRAFQYLNEMASENLALCESMKVKKPKVDDEHFGGGLTQRVSDLQGKIKKLEQDLKKKASQNVSVDDILKEAQEKELSGEKGLALMTRVDITDRNLLSDVADKIRDKKQNIALVLIGEGENGKPKPMIVAISKRLKSLHAGKITQELCSIMDGKGGGRPDFAQGSVSNLDKLNQAKDKFYELLEK
jgi:alanyl-tRNA synthetase